MPDEWIIRVEGRDYGPADLETLEEWKQEGRVLAQNPARRADTDLWSTASEIPGLFSAEPVEPFADSVAGGAERGSVPDVETWPQSTPAPKASASGEDRMPIAMPAAGRSFGLLLGDTFRIYRKGFVQFFYLTMLVTLPWMCGQLSGFAVNTPADAAPDLRTAAAAAFTLCMLMLLVAAWPVYVAGIQVLTAELAAGRRPQITALLPDILKWWPKVAILCVFVYLIFFLLMMFAFGIMAMMVVAASTLIIIPIALGLMVLQVWMFGRFYINVMFWQQFAVLNDSDPGTALRQSKELARSRGDLPWYQRPMWRAVFIASLWILFEVLLYIGPDWTNIRNYFHTVTTTTDPQAILDAVKANQPSTQFNLVVFGLGLFERLVRPLLGIAFVLLYLDSRGSEAK